MRIFRWRWQREGFRGKKVHLWGLVRMLKVIVLVFWLDECEKRGAVLQATEATGVVWGPGTDMQGQGQGPQPAFQAWALIRKPEVLLKFALVRYRDCRRRTLASKGIDDVSVHRSLLLSSLHMYTYSLCISGSRRPWCVY